LDQKKELKAKIPNFQKYFSRLLLIYRSLTKVPKIKIDTFIFTFQ
jgi:hypothetical protein